MRKFAPLAIILGIPMIFAAIYFYTTPVVLITGGDQGIFKCGSPSSPNSDAKNVCQDPERVERNKAVYSGLSGVALIGLGVATTLVGARRGEDDEDFFDDERPRRGRGDIDLRDDDEESRVRGSDAPLRGARRERGERRERLDDDFADAPETRGSRRERRLSRDDTPDEPRSRRRDDDLDALPSRRRDDDDWASDGWR